MPNGGKDTNKTEIPSIETMKAEITEILSNPNSSTSQTPYAYMAKLNIFVAWPFDPIDKNATKEMLEQRLDNLTKCFTLKTEVNIKLPFPDIITLDEKRAFVQALQDNLREATEELRNAPAAPSTQKPDTTPKAQEDQWIQANCQLISKEKLIKALENRLERAQEKIKEHHRPEQFVEINHIQEIHLFDDTTKKVTFIDIQENSEPSTLNKALEHLTKCFSREAENAIKEEFQKLNTKDQYKYIKLFEANLLEMARTETLRQAYSKIYDDIYPSQPKTLHSKSTSQPAKFKPPALVHGRPRPKDKVKNPKKFTQPSFDTSLTESDEEEEPKTQPPTQTDRLTSVTAALSKQRAQADDMSPAANTGIVSHPNDAPAPPDTVMHSRQSPTVERTTTPSAVIVQNPENLSIVEICHKFQNAINTHNKTANPDKHVNWKINKPGDNDLSFDITNNNNDNIGTVRKTTDQSIAYSFNEPIKAHEAAVVLNAVASNELELKSDNIEDIVNILSAANLAPHNEGPNKKNITLDDATKQVLKLGWDSMQLGTMPDNIKKYLEEPTKRPDFK